MFTTQEVLEGTVAQARAMECAAREAYRTAVKVGEDAAIVAMYLDMYNVAMSHTDAAVTAYNREVTATRRATRRGAYVARVGMIAGA